MSAEDANGPTDRGSVEECTICFQEISFKTTLPDCKHSFCFLCAKGAALRSGSCPLCRAPISPHIFDDPKMALRDNLGTEPGDEIKIPSVDVAPTTSHTVETAAGNREAHGDAQPGEAEKPQWFYAGRNDGWWQFEPRLERTIEEAFRAGKDNVDLLIAGYNYTLDFIHMTQCKKNVPRTPRWERTICRTITNDPAAELNGLIKGTAGLRSVQLPKSSKD